MLYLILLSAFSGAVVTLLLQFLLLYRRSPEPVGRTVQYGKVVPENALKEYFNGQHTEPGPHHHSQHQGQDGTASAPAKAPEAGSGRQQEAQAVPGRQSHTQPLLPPPPPPSNTETPEANRAETCHFLNAIFLFLFRELRDTPVVRHWLTKKIKVCMYVCVCT